VEKDNACDRYIGTALFLHCGAGTGRKKKFLCDFDAGHEGGEGQRLRQVPYPSEPHYFYAAPPAPGKIFFYGFDTQAT
jgi:hypothetical protein